MKKQSKLILMVLVAALLAASLMLLGGCGNNDVQPPEPDEEKSDVPDEPVPEEPDKELSPEEKAALSEKAMQNFLDKICSENYVMDSKDYLKTTVYSPDLVIFDYADDSAYMDFAVMSVNDEVFQGLFWKDSIDDVAFVKEGQAIDAASSRLPTNWLTEEFSDGNIYNIFYNDTEDPLRFVSYDTNVQNQVRTFAGYGDVALRYMHEVYLILDQEDPTVAHIQAEVDDSETARYYFDDIDIVITFGDAQPDTRAEAWMKDPVYPEARTEWTEKDLFIFNSVFLPGYGGQAIPFIPSASYALSVDEEHFISDDRVYIRDPHATEEDLKDYEAVLLRNGFEKVNEDGEECYRALLREETNCYSSISLGYDNGLDLTAEKYYVLPKYEGIDEINGKITENGYPELPASDALTGFTALDHKDEDSESWLYFFDYNTVLYVTAGYTDRDEVMSYLDGYAEALAAKGFSPVYVDGDEGGEIESYRSEDEASSFRYHFEDDGETVAMLFKSEKCLTASETKKIIEDAGFPEIDLAAYNTGRDHIRFLKVMYGRDFDSAVTMTMRFGSAEEADAFLHQYVDALEDDGFLKVPASELGSNKNNGYTNEETGLGMAFDFIPGADGGETYIYFDFRSGIDFSINDEPSDELPGFSDWFTGALQKAVGEGLDAGRAETAAYFLDNTLTRIQPEE